VSKWFQAWEDEPIIRYTIDVPKPVGDGTATDSYRHLVQQQYSAMLRQLANFLDS